MKIDPGEMRTKIIIEQLVEQQGPQGGPVEQWSDFKTAWAALRPQRQIERELTRQRVGVTGYRVVMRWTPGITPKMRVRVVNSGAVLKILGAVNHEMRNQLLFLDCEEYT